MNETYWGVVEPIWNRKKHGLIWFTVSPTRSEAIWSYMKVRNPDSTDVEIRHRWRKEYRKGARCVKVRLVLEGE